MDCVPRQVLVRASEGRQWEQSLWEEIDSQLVSLKKLFFEVMFTLTCYCLHLGTACSKGYCNSSAGDWVQCELCPQWFHCGCAGLTLEDAAKETFSFVCKYC